MKTVSKILTLAAASAVVGLGLFSTTPASAFNSPYDDQRLALSNPGWVDYDQDAYDRPGYGWRDPAYGVTSGRDRRVPARLPFGPWRRAVLAKLKLTGPAPRRPFF